MKKWKDSTAVKLLIAFLVIINTCVTVGSGFGIVAMYETGVYSERKEDFKKERYDDLLYRSSIEALADMGKGEKNQMYNSNFKYGIIKAESLENVDLNNEKVYVERNFSDKVNLEDLHTYSTRVTEDTTFSFQHGLLGYAYAENNQPTEQIENEIESYGYDFDRGILFTTVKEKNYPVLNFTIELRDENYVFQYEPYSQDYYFLEGNDIGDIVSWQEFPLTVFNNTRLDFSKWERVQIGERYVYPDEIRVYDHENIDYVDPDRNYYEDHGSLVTWGESLAGDNYYVVSYVQEPLKSYGSFLDEDCFVQWNDLTNLFYDLKGYMYFICGGFLFLTVIGFILLGYGVGHRKNKDEIVLRACDRLPFEIFTIFIGILVVSLIYIIGTLGFYYLYVIQIPVIVTSLICVLILLIWYYSSIVVRIKSKKFWQYTLIHKFGKVIVKIVKTISRNIDILWKALLVMFLLALVEGFVIIATGYDPEIELVIWFIEKCVIYLIVLIVILQIRMLKEGGKHLAQGDLSHQIDTKKMFWEFKEHGENLNKVGEGISVAVDDRLKSERFKTELITNVSHDIKTPLTSIINYVDLLEKEDIENENVKEYLEVLDRQSNRLKKLIEDLMEASKASTGNLMVNMEKLEAGVFMVQTVGEFEEKTAANQLELITVKPDEEIFIMADPRHLWRVFDNLMNNICKYAQPGTRVYINLSEKNGEVNIAFKNTSKYQLNISSEELMERFVRGDSSRNTEGNGLGLSIARSLTELIGGTFKLSVDGDFFKVELIFPKI